MGEPLTDEPVSPSDMIFMAMVGNAQINRPISVVQGGPTEAPPASLSGRVFLDADGDGLPGEGDQGVGGVEIVLMGRTVRGQPVRAVLKTDPDGRYTFEGLPAGSYAVGRVGGAGRPRAGTVNGVPVGEARDAGVERIGLPPGAMAEGYSFAEVRPAGLSGLVLLEEDDDEGTAEAELEGAQVILSGVDGLGRVIQLAARTDARGAYRFSGLHPGKYDLFASPRKGYAARAARQGDRGGRADGPGKVAGVDLRSGAMGSGYNFTLVPVGAILGRVGRGAGMRVALSGTDEFGCVVARMGMTVEGGGYRFDRLRPGTYRVAVESRAAFRARAGHAGGRPGEGCVDGIVLAPGSVAGGYEFEPGSAL